MIKVLNLYSGLGGNRKLWKDVRVIAIENNEEIATLYSEQFPKDKIILTDAHEYLLKHYNEFDFIWSSPPCQTHSRSRYGCVCAGKTTPKYPDMRLYQEIIFLKHHSKSKWVVENVLGYYNPLIPGRVINRHIFWSNFTIPKPVNIKFKKIDSMSFNAEHYGFSLNGYNIKTRKDQILKNLVNPELGLYIFNNAFRIKQLNMNDIKQVETNGSNSASPLE